jgi:predicted nucleotidyltransferase
MAISLNTYIRELAYRYYIGRNTVESVKIDTSVSNLFSSVKNYFGKRVISVGTFGSYTRDTILPRTYDRYSDVDIMVVFNQDTLYTSETYRTWLKQFAEFEYKRSRISKDFPTVVVDMNHIKLDLIPTLIDYDRWYNSTTWIPDRNNSWQTTDPNGFNSKLIEANTRYNSVVKPIIRLLKAWNSRNEYPYYSFELEQFIADMDFTGDTYQTGLFYAIDKLPTYSLNYSGESKVNTLVNYKNWVVEYLDREDTIKAKEWLHRILPY